MGNRETPSQPQWKRLFFTKGIALASRFGYLGIPLPRHAALDRYYDWQEGDVPGDDDIVQWLVLFEYVAFTTTGNRFLQGCFRAAPRNVRSTLFPYFLRKLHPFYLFDNITGVERNPACFLPVEARLLFFGNTPFFAEDVPFMHDTSVPWPVQDSGAFQVDFSRAAGVDMLVPEGFASRHSLRMSKFGERGPQILVHRSENRLREQFEMRMEQRAAALAKTAATIREQTLSIDNMTSTLVEAHSGLPVRHDLPLQPCIPSNDILPGHDDSVFLVSGMTQGILGRGGMGMVYKIFNTELEVFRALKVLNPATPVGNPEEWELFCRRFLREAKLLANLHHTHIAQIHGFGEWQQYPYIEMEYVDGADIKTLLKANSRIAVPAATGIAIQMARALSHAHNKRYVLDGKERQGLIHRDLKPQNIMLSRDGESKLLDFGVAMPVGNLTSTVSSESFIGTLQYASPEQIAGAELDLRTDIHSFGQVLAEMVSGRPAFPARDVREIISRKLNNDFDVQNAFPSGIPKTLRHIIKTCLQRDPDRRFRSSEDLLSVLEEAHREITTEHPDAVVREYATDPARVKSGGVISGGRKLLQKFFHRGNR